MSKHTSKADLGTVVHQVPTKPLIESAGRALDKASILMENQKDEISLSWENETWLGRGVTELKGALDRFKSLMPDEPSQDHAVVTDGSWESEQALAMPLQLKMYEAIAEKMGMRDAIDDTAKARDDFRHYSTLFDPLGDELHKISRGDPEGETTARDVYVRRVPEEPPTKGPLLELHEKIQELGEALDKIKKDDPGLKPFIEPIQKDIGEADIGKWPKQNTVNITYIEKKHEIEPYEGDPISKTKQIEKLAEKGKEAGLIAAVEFAGHNRPQELAYKMGWEGDRKQTNKAANRFNKESQSPGMG